MSKESSKKVSGKSLKEKRADKANKREEKRVESVPWEVGVKKK